MDELEDMDVSLIKGGVRVRYFQDLITAQLLDIYHFLRYQMKELDIAFPLIPHNPMQPHWFGHDALSKLDGF